MQTITNNSFTITHYRTSVTRSFWEIVSFYNYELTQWLIKHGDIDPNISVEENEEESIITYNNDNILDTNIVITILSNKNDETTCISENSIIADELKRDDFQQFLKKATERLITDFQEEENELEEEFQAECAIEYAREHI